MQDSEVRKFWEDIIKKHIDVKKNLEKIIRNLHEQQKNSPFNFINIKETPLQ